MIDVIDKSQDLVFKNNSFVNLIVNDINFKVTNARISESLDNIFNIECECFYEGSNTFILNDLNCNLHTSNLVNVGAKFVICNPSKTIINDKEKIYNGIVASVSYLGFNTKQVENILNQEQQTHNLENKHFFKFNIKSCLSIMSFNVSNRIFTNLSIVDIIKEVSYLYVGRIKKTLDFSNLKLNHRRKEIVIQYKESDLDFIMRLAHNEGIYFYEDEQKICFYDVSLLDSEDMQIIKFNSNKSNFLNEECIFGLRKTNQINFDSLTYSSVSGANPIKSKSYSTSTNLNDEDKVSLEFSYHKYIGSDNFCYDNDAYNYANIHNQDISILENTFVADSNIYDLSLNDFIKVDLSDGLNKTFKDFKIISIEHTIVDEAILLNTINSNDGIDFKNKNLTKSYFNKIKILPTHIHYKAALKPKPIPPQLTQAVVIGETNDIQSSINTIYTDEYGRIKVRMNMFVAQENIDEHKNHSKQNDDLNKYSYHHTCFLRVSSYMSSNNSGLFAIPRVGDEVIVSFLDNDIDKPIVVGSLYNRFNPPLPSLDTDYHQTTISSKTIGVGENGRNELTFSNIKEHEKIYLKAEKNYSELIQHDFNQEILNDKGSLVEGYYNERIKKAHIQTIDLAKNVNIGAEYLINVGLSKDTIVGLSNTLNVGVDNKVRVAKDYSEYVGSNKDIEVAKNQHTTIHNNYVNNIHGNKEETIGGYLNMNVSNGVNCFTEEHFVIQANNHLDLYTEENLTTQTNKQHTEISDSKYSEIGSNYEVEAGSKIVHKVGNTILEISDGMIIMKVGGVEVVLDSSGLSVKGGEIKAE